MADDFIIYRERNAIHVLNAPLACRNRKFFHWAHLVKADWMNLMKTALIYDWFSKIPGGGEKAFEAIYKLFPSPIYTLMKCESSLIGTSYQNEAIHSSFIQKFPKSTKLYRSYLPLFPLAIEQFDLSAYDLIISCSHCVAKGIMTHADQIHLCYCYTPMRYAWDLYHQYLNETGLKRGIKGRLAQLFLHYIRMWDVQSSARVDAFGAISHHVARRIKKTYGREATVIYPPVNIDFFEMSTQKENYYVTASRFVPYKKIDLIVEAFSRMPEKRLVVIGEGPDEKKIANKAAKNIELIGYQNDESLKKHLQRAKAFVYAAIEDFGILPLEAQACGTPVIGYGKGALLETVKVNQTGILFTEQNTQSIQDAVRDFEKRQFDPIEIRNWALNFSEERFGREFRKWVKDSLDRLQPSHGQKAGSLTPCTVFKETE